MRPAIAYSSRGDAASPPVAADEAFLPRPSSWSPPVKAAPYCRAAPAPPAGSRRRRRRASWARPRFTQGAVRASSATLAAPPGIALIARGASRRCAAFRDAARWPSRPPVDAIKPSICRRPDAAIFAHAIDDAILASREVRDMDRAGRRYDRPAPATIGAPEVCAKIRFARHRFALWHRRWHAFIQSEKRQTSINTGSHTTIAASPRAEFGKAMPAAHSYKRI